MLIQSEHSRWKGWKDAISVKNKYNWNGIDDTLSYGVTQSTVTKTRQITLEDV